MVIMVCLEPVITSFWDAIKGFYDRYNRSTGDAYKVTELVGYIDIDALNQRGLGLCIGLGNILDKQFKFSVGHYSQE